ncbi:hypothetical protein V9T40_002163 [Parthenolecanium corni]|uniref:Carboxylic ester hydrolase n=1 Tax=Parthenolecanium corni TaxID=536013 RepID=A0AAN9Y539_9HEMI
MDIIAGLHWLRENLPSFGGDPDRITVMGHSTGAALANFIAASPVTRELLHRVVLISGSGLSPWAIQRDPLMIKRKVAEQTSCHGDLLLEDMAPCLRLKKLSELLDVHVDAPRFLPGFAPFVDGTVLLNGVTDTVVVPDILTLARNKKGRGFELSDFPDRDLLFGITTLESYADFCAQDLEFGFSESKRDRVLRTFVRNCYYFHLNEIFSTLKNEYTDWEKPVQSPLSVRDSTLDVLSDGHTVSCLLKVGYLHSIRGGRTFFFHFAHPLNDKEFPQKFESIRGDDVPFVLGFPLLGSSQFFSKNFSASDVHLCKQFIRYISNFARKGDPNGFATTFDEKDANSDFPYWDTYDSVNQLYLELDAKLGIPEITANFSDGTRRFNLQNGVFVLPPAPDESLKRSYHLMYEIKLKQEVTL